MTSNELEDLGREMARIHKSRNLGQTDEGNKVHRAKVYIAPYTCHDESDESLICKVEAIGDPELNTRFYDIEVTARDEIGNVGSATCSVIVIPRHHLYLGKSSKGSNLCASSKSGKGATATEQVQDMNMRRHLQAHHNMSGKSGKVSSSEHNANDLRDEFVLSTQRFQIASMELEWDTSLDRTRDPPTPTQPPPLTGKSGKHALVPNKTPEKITLEEELPNHEEEGQHLAFWENVVWEDETKASNVTSNEPIRRKLRYGFGTKQTTD